jgi:hypothetical protein
VDTTQHDMMHDVLHDTMYCSTISVPECCTRFSPRIL